MHDLTRYLIGAKPKDDLINATAKYLGFRNLFNCY